MERFVDYETLDYLTGINFRCPVFGYFSLSTFGWSETITHSDRSQSQSLSLDAIRSWLMQYGSVKMHEDAIYSNTLVQKDVRIAPVIPKEPSY